MHKVFSVLAFLNIRYLNQLLVVLIFKATSTFKQEKRHGVFKHSFESFSFLIFTNTVKIENCAKSTRIPTPL